MSNYHQAQELAVGMEKTGLMDDVPDDNGVDGEWLRLAKDAFRGSTVFMESSLKRQWEKNMAHFRSKHAPGSKYYSDAYSRRSKLFRPKIRSMLRRHEAGAAMAYFATQDAVHINAEDESNPEQVMGSEILMELMNFRLDKSIPWFLTLIGAYQEAMNIGSVISYQHWTYKEHKTTEEVEVKDGMGRKIIGEDGNIMTQPQERVEIVKDEPFIDLRPSENIRIDPACDWNDPIESSPYFIDLLPMYVYEILERMKNPDDKTGEPAWFKLSEGQIHSAVTENYDSLRRQREGSQREDSKDKHNTSSIYQLAWVHRNFIRKDGVDYLYYTLGDQFMLSEPVPAKEVYHKDYRPYVYGICNIETHRVYPSSTSELGEQLQNEINEVTNTRIDNVKLAINQRYYVRRGGNVDYRALMRSAPGAGILMDNVNEDVKPEEISDVTSSSYQEQDRLANELDDIVGSFSPSSVQSNRKLNETVGGMNLLSGDANTMSEYQLRVFNETWVEPVLRQLMDNIKLYETDEQVFAIAGKRANLEKKYGIAVPDWRMIQSPTNLTVSVGFGATSPEKRIEKLAIGLNTVLKFVPNLMKGVDGEEVVSEVFGALGHKDGKRFFKSLQDDSEQDPLVQQLEQENQQLKEIIKTEQVKEQGKITVAQIREQGATQREQMKLGLQRDLEQIKTQLSYIDRQLSAETNELARAELLLEQNALVHAQRIAEIKLLQEERNSLSIKQPTVKQTGTDDSKAGLIQRDQYGSVPFAQG